MLRWTCIIGVLLLVGCTESAPTTNENAQTGAQSVTPGPTDIQKPNKPDGWVEFSEPTGAFSIYTPAAPQVDAVINVPLPGGMGPKIYRGSGNGLGIYLSYFDRNPEEVPTIRSTMYERGGTTGLAPLGNVGARRDVTWAGHAAAEFEVESAHATTIVRVLNVGNRFYICHIAGEGGHPDATEREAFFGSFTIGR